MCPLWEETVCESFRGSCACFLHLLRCQDFMACLDDLLEQMRVHNGDGCVHRHGAKLLQTTKVQQHGIFAPKNILTKMLFNPPLCLESAVVCGGGTILIKDKHPWCILLFHPFGYWLKNFGPNECLHPAALDGRRFFTVAGLVFMRF